LAYTVTKCVNGRRYRYLQESYRVGSEVHTRSVYLGPVDKTTREAKNVSPTDPKFVDTVRQEVRDRIVIAGSPQQPPPTVSPKDIPEFRGTPQGLTIKINCKSKLIRISRAALEACWRANQKRLLNIGIFPAKVPQLSVEYGMRVRVFKGILSKRYVVTVPRFIKINREKLRFEFFRAISVASIEVLQKERPDLYMRLSLHFDENFLMTQRLLTQYISVTRDFNALAKILMLRCFGNMPPIAGGRLEPEKLGLVEYGRRKTWQDEAASLMAEIQKYGWNKAYKNSFVEMKKAQKAVFCITQDPWQWGKHKRLKLQRAELRIRLNEAKLGKLNILKEIFGFGKGKSTT
jgi:hypothetical protein